MSDRTEDGRQLKLLVVINKYTREGLAIEVGRDFNSQQVNDVLCYLFAVQDRPTFVERSEPLKADVMLKPTLSSAGSGPPPSTAGGHCCP